MIKVQHLAYTFFKKNAIFLHIRENGDEWKICFSLTKNYKYYVFVLIGAGLSLRGGAPP